MGGALQGALEGRSKPGTYIERNPENGHLLLVSARAAVAEDLPKYNPPTRQVPDDLFKADVKGTRYILAYHGETHDQGRTSSLGLQVCNQDDDIGRLGNDGARLQRTDDGAIITTAIDGSCRVETARGRLRRLCRTNGGSYSGRT